MVTSYSWASLLGPDLGFHCSPDSYRRYTVRCMCKYSAISVWVLSASSRKSLIRRKYMAVTARHASRWCGPANNLSSHRTDQPASIPPKPGFPALPTHIGGTHFFAMQIFCNFNLRFICILPQISDPSEYHSNTSTECYRSVSLSIHFGLSWSHFPTKHCRRFP